MNTVELPQNRIAENNIMKTDMAKPDLTELLQERQRIEEEKKQICARLIELEKNGKQLFSKIATGMKEIGMVVKDINEHEEERPQATEQHKQPHSDNLDEKIIAFIDKFGPARVSEVMTHISKPKSHTVRLLDNLVKREVLNAKKRGRGIRAPYEYSLV